MGLRQTNDEGRALPFYLHLWEFDPGQPRIRLGALSRLHHPTNLYRCEARLREVQRSHRLLAAVPTKP